MTRGLRKGLLNNMLENTRESLEVPPTANAQEIETRVRTKLFADLGGGPTLAAEVLGIKTDTIEIPTPENQVGEASRILRSVPGVERSQMSGHPGTRS